ncbi:hypothetical protein CRUP_015795 [Coryphaenoides rupestris]|nr:hypothetical protein CRUP_015795 [Coryphaenoides rupestris]
MDLTEQINQLEADLQELGSLLEKAERKRVQELLKEEQKKIFFSMVISPSLGSALSFTAGLLLEGEERRLLECTGRV